MADPIPMPDGRQGDERVTVLGELAATPEQHDTGLDKLPPPPPRQAAVPCLQSTVTLAPTGGHADGEMPRIAGYELLGELGRGGMGIVYKARQIGLNRLVALKMIRGAYVDEQGRVRFQSEAEAVARLQHPNIVQIHEIGTQDGLPFFSLEFVDGGSLDKHVGNQPQ